MLGAIKSRGTTRQKKTITIPGIALWIVVVLSFVPHLFFYSINARVYLAVLAVSVLFYIIGKPTVVYKWKSIIIIWAAACMLVSYSRSLKLSGSMIDVSVLLLGMILAIFFSQRIDDYKALFPCLKVFAFFFSAGALIRPIFPGIFQAIVLFFPSSYRAVVLTNSASGFTTNPGFSAGYIIAGIIAVVSMHQGKKKYSVKEWVALFFLTIGFMMTGKRGPAIFIIMTLILCHLLPLRGEKRLKKYWIIFLIALLLISLFFILRDFLVTIPVIGGLTKTIYGILDGEDVSTGRGKLYSWALQLFLRNPWFGIGWGDYRTTVVGNATFAAVLDAHNIYLQLLCETGIVGTISFLTMFLVFWMKARKMYFICANSKGQQIRALLPYAFFSFAYQTYFLLYGLSGNTLYDQNYQIIYMISCAMTLTIHYQCRIMERQETN